MRAFGHGDIANRSSGLPSPLLEGFLCRIGGDIDAVGIDVDGHKVRCQLLVASLGWRVRIMSYIVAAFYHFFDFPDFTKRRTELLKLFHEHNIKGSLLIAPEGFNGAISGTRESIDATLAHLKTLGGEFEHKESLYDRQPFGKAKVRLKKETIGLGEPCPSDKRGEYVEPRDWNALIADPDTIVLDTRNVYETHLGMFEGALDPKTKNFKQLPNFVRETLGATKHKKIAAYCTGGIRCEKFTAWLRQEGFENVYHLKGGILKYLEEIPESKSKWRGECYVFDARIAVRHGLIPSSTASMCKACGHTIKEEDRKHLLYMQDVSCPYCH